MSARQVIDAVCGAGGAHSSPCGRLIYDLSDLYRCTHCDRPFHKACALRHFGMEHCDGDAFRAQCNEIERLRAEVSHANACNQMHADAYRNVEAHVRELVAAARVRVSEGHDVSCRAIRYDEEIPCECGHTALADALRAALAGPR